jgi:hypothetical protein
MLCRVGASCNSNITLLEFPLHTSKVLSFNFSPETNYRDSGSVWFFLVPAGSAVLTNSAAPEPEVSSPHSQQPDTGPYPEPIESTPSPPANLPKIHSDPIISSMPRSSEWSLSFELSHQNLVHFSLLSHACHMPCLLHPPWLDLPNNI